MNPTGASDLIITVGGDLTPLENTLAAVPEAFAGVTSDIENAFAGLNTVTTDLQNLATAAGEAVAPVESLAEQLDLFADAPLATLPELGEQLQLFSTYAGEAAGSVQNLNSSLNQLPQGEGQANSSLLELAASFYLLQAAIQIIKGAIDSLVEAYGNLEKAQLALGSILKDQSAANTAIASTKQLADTLGLAQDAAISAQQKLAAMGIALKDIPGDLTAIADGAAAMNTSFDTAAQRFDQIVNSGTLMARSLTSIGLNVNDVASAMGMLGVPIATLNTSFKELDEQQRAAVLSMAELTKNAGDAEKAASGVLGTWNQVKNALESAKQAMGEAVDGFAGLATAATTSIKVIEDLFIAFVGDVKIAMDSLILFGEDVGTIFSGIGQVVSAAFSGNFKSIPGIVKDTLSQLDTNFQAFSSEAQKDWGDTAAAIGKIWGDGMKTIGDNTNDTLNGLLKGFSIAQDYANRLATEFQAISVAFKNGALTASQYTAALNQLNKAQEDANNGLQNAGTALLLIQNAYREMNVAVANAATNLAATAAAVDSGTASWTQYVSALNTLNTAQMAANGGLQELGTVMNLVDVQLEQTAIDLVNAQTHLAAVTAEAAKGNATFLQHVAAVNAVQAAYLKLGAGIMDAATAFQQALDNQQLANISFANLTIQVNAAYAAWRQTGQGLQEYLDLVAKLPGANEAANNGLLSMATATETVTAQHVKLEETLTNAVTLLGALGAKYAQDASYGGEYAKQVEAVQKAQDALNGSATNAAKATQAASDATKNLTTANTSAASSFNVLKGALLSQTDAAQQVSQHYQQLGIDLQNAQTWLQAVQAAYNQGRATAPMLIAALQGVKKAQDDLTGGTAGASGALSSEIVAMENIVSQAPGVASALKSVASASAGISSGMSSIGSSATAATGQVNTLAQQINQMDKAAVDAFDSLNGASLQVAIGANSLVSRPNPSSYQSEGGLGNSMPLLPGQQPYNTTQEIINSTATMSAAVKDATAAVTDLTTATTAATPIVISNYNALGQLTDQFGNVIKSTVPALTDLTTAAVAALSATDASTAAMNALNLATTTVTQGAMAAATAIATIGTATEPFVAALTGIGHILGVGGGNTGTPTIGLPAGTYVVPSGGANGGVGGPNSALNTSLSSTVGGPSVNLSVNLSGSVLTGANGMQQLQQQIAAAMVNELARRGIRMTRG